MQGTGFFHLNAANQWQAAQFFQSTANADGVIQLLPKAALATGFLERGAFLIGPLQVFSTTTPWFRLRALATPLPENTHLRFFTFASDGPLPPGFNLTDDDPFADVNWVKQPRDEL